MKDKIKIIYLTNYTITESKWFRQEMNYFKENSDFEIHELSDFLFPSMRKVSGDAYEKKKILTFKTFLNWKNYVLNLRQKCIKEEKKLVVLTELSHYPWLGYNLKYLMVNKFLRQCEIDYYEMTNHGASAPKGNPKTYLKYIKIFRYWRYLLIRLNEKLVSFFGILLGLKPKGIFVAGSQTKKELENLIKTKSIELIDISSWEFSSTLIKKNDDTNSFREKYAVFINESGPKKPTDDLILHIPRYVTSEKWYPALNNFFAYMEKIFNLRIIIASHPKSYEEGCLDFLGNRTAVMNKTEELIRGSEFVISGNSNALTYAIVYKKPILLIYSNETKKDDQKISQIKNLTDYFKTKSINIDESFSESQIKSLINFDEKLYENYKTEFLTSNSKNINYQIILKHLNK